jgi:hypothetical protein
MRKIGCAVAHGRKIVAKRHCKRTGHVDTPDAAAVVAIEVKERSLKFDGPESFPYDTVYVDDLRGMKRESHINLIYVFLSKPTGAWVWLTILDRDDSWKEGKTTDRERGHEVPILEAPKKFLRPASALLEILYPRHKLGLIDGEAGAFAAGGGATETVERYVAGEDSKAGEGAGDGEGKAN